MELKVDQRRYQMCKSNGICTGIYVRAQDEADKWISVDISLLTKDSLFEWLRSRGGENLWAESVVGILLGHGPFGE